MRTAHKCLYEAIKACKPGALIRDLGKVMYVNLLVTCNARSSC